jgi:hypothetical protein
MKEYHRACDGEDQFDEEVVLRVVRHLYWKKYMSRDPYTKALGDAEGRDVHIHFYDGYGVASNRTAFFAVGGSPNKVVGCVTSYQDGKATYTSTVYGRTSRQSLDIRQELLDEYTAKVKKERNEKP